VPDERIDVALFGQHVRQARTLLEGGRPEQAAARLDQAFDLWRGPVLSGMKTGTVLAAHLTYIDELRYTATELHVEASKRLGRYREIIPRLRLMVAENPLNENFHAQLIQALHKCGRRAEALQAYRNLWRILDIELGVEPAPELQLLQHELLARRGVARGVVHGRS
jgi:DNA-binding SARP family transcriptional activator